MDFPENNTSEVLKQGLFSFQANLPYDGYNKSFAIEDTKLKDIDELNQLFMKDLIEDIITTDTNLPPIVEENHNNYMLVQEIKDELKDEALQNLLKNKQCDIDQNDVASLEEIQTQIIDDTVSKTTIIQFSSYVSEFTPNSMSNFIKFLKVDNRFFNLCKGPGFINLLKPLFQLCSIFSENTNLFEGNQNSEEIGRFELKIPNSSITGQMLDFFLELFKINLDIIIFDKKTYKIIEKLIKLPISSKETEEIKKILLNDIYKYASNQYSCHVLKVLLSIAPLSDTTSDYIHKVITQNLMLYSKNKASSSLVISSLYVSILIYSYYYRY
jgi:hypothetical protein